jgi:DNA polymerase III sliding clamp (beta) subunit (PCNA family)
MRFSCSATALRDALSRVRQVIPSTPSLIAYTAVLFQCRDGALDMTASDGDTTMTVTVNVADAVDGSSLLVPKPLLGFLGSVDADVPVRVDVTETGDVTVSAQGLRPYTFRPLSATFPLPQKPASGVRPESMAHFATALSAVKAAHDRETTAVQLVSDGSQLTVHATDRFRLARAVLPGAGFGTFTGVLSLPVLERVARMEPSEVTVDMKNRQLSFRGADAVLTSRLLAVPFEAVETILLAAPPEVTGFPARECARALSRLASVAEQGTLSIEFNEREMHLQASATEIGSGHEVVELTSPVPAPFRLLLRARYLQEAVTAMADATVAVSYSAPLQPVFLSCHAPFPITHVVMPVKG